MALHFCSSNIPPTFSSHHHSSSKSYNTPPKGPRLEQKLSRRRAAAAVTLATALLGTEAFFNTNSAFCFEFRFVVPDQTPEEANAVVLSHARALLGIKPLIDSQSWREAQLALRESSSLLKQDLYTIIQARPGDERPQLRKLYSNLFNNVSRLDYAARSKDGYAVQECYDNIVAALREFFSKIT